MQYRFINLLIIHAIRLPGGINKNSFPEFLGSLLTKMVSKLSEAEGRSEAFESYFEPASRFTK